ncbi:MAG TPA: hypothetical protein VK078_01935 [Pseudogracilibacillus sp.]|nr:hypothetical protein [Pseudogracilibacillus sp.]
MSKKMFWFVGMASAISLLWAFFKMNESNEQDTLEHTFENAGKPGQLEEGRHDAAQRENADMVSEGSQFGVQYFNKTSKEEKEELEKNKTT